MAPRWPTPVEALGPPLALCPLSFPPSSPSNAMRALPASRQRDLRPPKSGGIRTTPQSPGPSSARRPIASTPQSSAPPCLEAKRDLVQAQAREARALERAAALQRRLEQLQADRAIKKRQKLIMNTTREENIGTNLSGAALDDDTNDHMNQHRATIPCPYQLVRMEAMRLMLERDHDFTFRTCRVLLYPPTVKGDTVVAYPVPAPNIFAGIVCLLPADED